MPIDVTDTDSGLGKMIHIGEEVDEAHFMRFMQPQLTNQGNRCEIYRYGIALFATADPINFSTDSLYKLAGWCKQAAFTNPDVHIAIVADHDLPYGLARMWEFFMAGCTWKTGVFRNLSDARAWIHSSVLGRRTAHTIESQDNPWPTDDAPPDWAANGNGPFGE